MREVTHWGRSVSLLCRGGRTREMLKYKYNASFATSSCRKITGIWARHSFSLSVLGFCYFCIWDLLYLGNACSPNHEGILLSRWWLRSTAESHSSYHRIKSTCLWLWFFFTGGPWKFSHWLPYILVFLASNTVPVTWTELQSEINYFSNIFFLPVFSIKL